MPPPNIPSEEEEEEKEEEVETEVRVVEDGLEEGPWGIPFRTLAEGIRKVNTAPPPPSEGPDVLVVVVVVVVMVGVANDDEGGVEEKEETNGGGAVGSGMAVGRRLPRRSFFCRFVPPSPPHSAFSTGKGVAGDDGERVPPLPPPPLRSSWEGRSRAAGAVTAETTKDEKEESKEEILPL